MKVKHRRSVVMAIIAGVAIASTLAACSSTSPVISSKHVTLQMTVITNNVNPALTNAIKGFEKENPKVTIKLKGLAQAQYFSSVRTELGAGGGPDIFVTPGGSGNPMAAFDLAKAGILADLSNQTWVPKLIKSAKEVAGPNGKVYMWPAGLVSIDAIYSPSLFSANGLTVPKTYDQLLTYCSSAKSKGLIPFAFGAQDPTSAQMYTLGFLGSVYGPNPTFNTKVENGKEKLVDSKGWLASLQKVVDMNKAGCFNSSPAGTSFTDALATLASGKAGAMVWINALAGSLEAQNPKNVLASFTLPASNEESKNYTPVTAVGGFGINAKSPNKAVAEEFFDYLSEPKVAAAYFKSSNAISSLTNVSYKLSPVQQPVEDAIKSGKASTLPFWSNDQTQNVMIAGIQQLLNGQGTPLSVLQQMQASLTIK